MGESSVAWVDGALVLLDQRALPQEVRQLRITTVDEVIDAIKTLAVRGAPAIGVAGAFGVALAAAAHPGDVEEVESEAARIEAARPTAVNLAWGVRRAVAQVPQGARAVLDEALAMLDEDGRVNRAAATHAADLVRRLCPDRPLRLLTHCNTGRLATTAFGTALGAVRVLAERGAVENVLVDETRPLLQGARLTAWELAEAGIPHRLTIDSAAAWAMATGRVDCVIVGADRIAADGSVANKIGTYGLAVAAQRHGIPFLVVAPESTRDPRTATGAEIIVEERAAEEITHVGGVATAPEGTEAFNPAFDVTPPDLVTAVVTENGIVGEVNAPAGVPDPLPTRTDPTGPGSIAGIATNVVATPGESPPPVRTAESDDEPAVAERIAAMARGLYTRGWMPGTAGNISERSGERAVVTGSGLSKGELTAADMVTVNIADSEPVSGTRRPSAETTIHTAVYRATDAEAVVHVHPPHATACSTGAAESLRFAGYELIKGLGAAKAADRIDIPVFANHPDVPRIGADIERHLAEHPDAPPVLFITGHGITAWGATLAQARDRAECLEAMCELVALTGRHEI
ncbi:bifunctional S-methyl-5-thioribose-1-phosphate isomerase/methylthioribulose 1-phosphate dehydratase [Nocardia sp. BMG51109]|uniref:bifunctional S-methyl-5-thioribose-1-phosphate isomerase/methylthioribulose 1-phosphate dehydratase n=1 Tax=Nocardia sp. BMG51109 TaxID=1056816 RepID=UPI00046338A4|nr:bifunctional S-methyl-5-thioribose-1-phosphate isomerase/methylthioribulose 1-phosphate dehydratase [Nocardia sp. BMG51109]